MNERTILDLLGGLRSRVRERLQKVNTRTEQAVIGAGRHLEGVVDIAKSHIEELRGLLSGPLGTNNSALHKAIVSQATHVREHAAQLGAAVSAHAAEVTAVAANAREITLAAAQIEHANAAARVLSVNVRIESAKSGAAVFKTIATEMHALSKSIVEANARVQELATAMEVTLPRLVEQSAALRTMVTRYATEANTRIEHIDHEVGALRQTIDATLRASDGALASIISSSHAGLSELQFQDVCAQSLLQVDQWQAIAIQDVGAQLGAHVEVDGLIAGISKEDNIIEGDHAGELFVF